MEDGIIGLIGALILWMLTRIETLNRKVSRMEAKMETLCKLVINGRENLNKKKKS